MSIIVCKSQWQDYYTYTLMESNGLGVASVYVENDGVWISNLFVQESFRHQGIATALIDKALEVISNDEVCKSKEVQCMVDERVWLNNFYKRKGIVTHILL